MTIRKGKVLIDCIFSKVYNTSEEDVLLHYTDVAAFSGTKKSVEIKNKGMITSQIASMLYRYLESYHIDTFFIDLLNNNDLLVKRYVPIPLKVKMWNMASGALCKQFGLEKWTRLDCPVMEMFYRDAKQQYSPAGKDHFCALNIITPEDFDIIDSLSRKTNILLKSFFERRHLLIADFSLYFGKINDRIVICGGMDFESLHIGAYKNLSKESNFHLLKLDSTTESYQLIKDSIIA